MVESWRASRRSGDVRFAISLSSLPRNIQITRRSLRACLQNEEVLKKCAQEYLMRIKQEEQRYQTLKVHAEEKLDK